VIFLDRGRIVAQDTPSGLTRRMSNAQLRVTFNGNDSQVASVLKPHYADVSMPAHNVVVVTAEQHLIPRAILDIGNAGVEILDIDIRKPTLEDVFLDIARGNGRVN
jgi:ABC-2 type transport system ATP-binding protein